LSASHLAVNLHNEGLDELAGEPGITPVRELSGIGRFVFEPSPAVERARLLHLLCNEHDLAEPAFGLGLLTGDQLVQSPWLTPFEVLDVLPWRQAKVRDALKHLGAGEVEVKTRGKAVDPDPLHKQLKQSGDQRLTVFILRLGKRMETWITRRVIH